MGKFVKVATKAEIPDQSAKLVKIGDKRIALFNLGGQFYAIDDTCPHADGPLSEGSIEGEEVECPWHGSRFNIKTGEVTAEPAGENVARYNVRVTGDDIEVLDGRPSSPAPDPAPSMTEAAVHQHLPPGPAERYTLDADPESLKVLRWLAAEYGDLVCVWSKDRQHPSLFLNNPEHIRQVLVGNHANYVKGVGFERVKMLLGNGIITSDGEHWRRQRTMIQPAFNRTSVVRLSENVRARNLELREEWRGLADRVETINVTTAMSHYGLEVILRSIFSADLPRLVRESSPFAFLAEDPTRDIRTVLKVRKLGHVILGCIADRRRSGKRPYDFLSLLIDARDRKTGTAMTDVEIIDEIKTLIVAGHETSAGTLNWAWYLLSHHPDVQRRLLDEIAARLPRDDFTFEEVMGLEYMPRVLKETLRLYPPVWLFTRRAVAADRLGEYDVPAGTHIFISPYLLHRSAKHWVDPERFDPERFAGPEAEERERDAFIPFSAGSRRCAGEYFAFVLMQMHVAILAPRYRLACASDEPMDIDLAINLRSRSGIIMTVTHRNPGSDAR